MRSSSFAMRSRLGAAARSRASFDAVPVRRPSFFKFVSGFVGFSVDGAAAAAAVARAETAVVRPLAALARRDALLELRDAETLPRRGVVRGRHDLALFVLLHGMLLSVTGAAALGRADAVVG